MDRFILQPSVKKAGHYVCTDTVHNIVCVFKEHAYNETQEFSLIDGESFPSVEEALSVATYLREMGEWLMENHYDKII